MVTTISRLEVRTRVLDVRAIRLTGLTRPAGRELGFIIPNVRPRHHSPAAPSTVTITVGEYALDGVSALSESGALRNRAR